MGIRGLGHNESLDMWCMGVLLYEMTVGKSPFGSNSQETTCRLILKVDLRFPASIDSDAQDLIKGLCKLRPEERLTAPQAKRHAFVEKFYGRPPVAASEETCERPSVVDRRLRRDKDLLEAEMMQILQAKSATENELLKATMELESAHKTLRREKKLREKVEQDTAKLREREEEQLRELEELRSSMEAIAQRAAAPRAR